MRREGDAANLSEEAAATGCDWRLLPTLCDITVASSVVELARTLEERAPKLDALSTMPALLCWAVGNN